MDSNKLRSSGYQISDRVQFGGVFEPEKCKQIAKTSDGIDGYIEQNEIAMINEQRVQSNFLGCFKLLGNFRQEIDWSCSPQRMLNNWYRSISLDNHQLNQSRECQRSCQEQHKKDWRWPDVSSSLWTKMDQDFLTEEEVPELLKETYKHMGMNDYQPTKEDVTIWIQMTDTDGDGKVTLEDYEQLVLDSLRKQGISLE
ncbi:unnamed protein product (macronuclear) [Paramecium tetraurelia]|uniref:EF-hand domain-containing protein n=1 Tax=Paramecium tetraurelia TaxID=5888 RepID=A0DVC9_PARTE|nr:uncharacterized protein GSPATT00020660001 [Paramecium tetraurelia]CAK86996.1 unnamed protein product [Paramecium tetraurelia]|eukprot:XP_001454393.1 hypothetical protein (macronuclear) [Paramecium tetraurelia strain d4-2]